MERERWRNKEVAKFVFRVTIIRQVDQTSTHSTALYLGRKKPSGSSRKSRCEVVYETPVGTPIEWKLITIILCRERRGNEEYIYNSLSNQLAILCENMKAAENMYD